MFPVAHDLPILEIIYRKFFFYLGLGKSEIFTDWKFQKKY